MASKKEFLLTAFVSCLGDNFEEEMIFEEGCNRRVDGKVPCVIVHGFSNIIANSRRTYAKIEDFD